MTIKEKYKDYKISINNYTFRLLKESDKENYFKNLNPMDKEVAYYTNTTGSLEKEVVFKFLDQVIQSEERFDFIVVDDENNVIAESVLLDYDDEIRSAHYRVAIFKSEYLNLGIGTKMIKETLKFGFEMLNLHRIELEVFDINKRALHTYKNLGFIEEGILRDNIIIDNEYHNTIMMSLLKDEWITKEN